MMPVAKITFSVWVLVCLFGFVRETMSMTWDTDNEYHNKETRDLHEKEQMDCFQKPTELAIVLMDIWSDGHFQKAKEFLVDFISLFDIGSGQNDTRVSILSYGEEMHRESSFDLNTYRTKQKVLDAIKKMNKGTKNRFDTDEAIKYMHQQQLGDDIVRQEADKISLVITDWESYRPRESMIARDKDITLFAVGIGRSVSKDYLLEIAGSLDRVARLDTRDNLNAIIETLTKQICIERTTLDKICAHQPIELAVVLIHPWSMRDFVKAKMFVVNLTKEFDIGSGRSDTRVSVATYGQNVLHDDSFKLYHYRDKLNVENAIMKLPRRSVKNTGMAIKYMREQLLGKDEVRPHAHKIGLVITDRNTESWNDTETEGKNARADNIAVFVVGVGKASKTRMDELLRITGNDKNRVTRVKSFDNLESIKETLAMKMCFKEPKPKPTTRAPITLRRCFREPFDLVIVLESSMKIGEYKFRRAKEYLVKRLSEFDIGSNDNDARVSLIVYGGGLYLGDSFYLNDYSTKHEVLEAIKEIGFHNGVQVVDTASAIKYMHEQQFREDRVRPQAHKICWVFTDVAGQSMEQTERAAKNARADNITIIAIKPGSITMLELKSLEKITGDVGLAAYNYLNDVMDRLTKRTCIGPTTRWTPSGGVV